MKAMNVLSIRLVIAAGVFLSNVIAFAGDGRTSISLNGTWQIDESVSATDVPQAFGHTVVVPGMVNLSNPAFPDVDMFASREYLAENRSAKLDSYTRIPFGSREILPASAPLPPVGISLQKRNYFWYRTSFTVRTSEKSPF